MSPRVRLTTDYYGSISMHTMYEALARDRMREREQRAREARQAREVTADRHRVQVRPQASRRQRFAAR